MLLLPIQFIEYKNKFNNKKEGTCTLIVQAQ